MAQMLKCLPPMRETQVQSLGLIPGLGRSPEEGNGNTPVYEGNTPGFLPGETPGQRSLVGYSPQGRKESDMTEQLH